MVIKFEDDVKPVAQTENEFREIVAWLAKNPNAVKSYTISGGTLEENLAQAAYDKRKMTEAGNELAEPKTIRTRPETLDDKNTVKVRIWASPKIKRQPKPKTEVAK